MTNIKLTPAENNLFSWLLYCVAIGGNPKYLSTLVICWLKLIFVRIWKLYTIETKIMHVFKQRLSKRAHPVKWFSHNLIVSPDYLKNTHKPWLLFKVQWKVKWLCLPIKYPQAQRVGDTSSVRGVWIKPCTFVIRTSHSQLQSAIVCQ